MTGPATQALPLQVEFSVNGQRQAIAVEPWRTLADALRRDVGLVGVRLGCEMGVCGSCTVIFDGEPVRACMLLAVQADGADIETVEGLAEDGVLSPLQEAFRACHGLQCGFCTPGFLMLATALLRADPNPDRERIRSYMAANLCRCTGYTGIIDAVEQVVGETGTGEVRR